MAVNGLDVAGNLISLLIALMHKRPIANLMACSRWVIEVGLIGRIGRSLSDRGGGVWEIASFEVGDWPFVDGKSLQAIGGRKGGGKKTNGTLNHLLSRVLQWDEFLIAHSASCKWNSDYDSMLLLKRFYIYLVIYYDLVRRCPLVAAPINTCLFTARRHSNY